MKRSEMINKMTERILIDGVVDLWLYQTEADKILSLIESLGMLPPKYQATQNESEYMEGWEPEDD